jgi:hypothetical protein
MWFHEPVIDCQRSYYDVIKLSADSNLLTHHHLCGGWQHLKQNLLEKDTRKLNI